MARADDEVLAMLPWMVRDWLSSRARAVLKHEGRSIYRELLDHAWLSPGCALPDNDAVLAALADLTLDEWKAIRPVLLGLGCFEIRPEGLVNVKLHSYWLKARKLRSEKRRAGKKGGQVAAKTRRSAAKQSYDSATSKREAEPYPPSPSPSPSPTPLNGNGTPLTPRPWNHEAGDDWQTRFGSKPDSKLGIRISQRLKPLVDEHTWPVVRGAWRRCLSEDGKYASPERFAEKFRVWMEPQARGPTRATVGSQTADVIREIARREGKT